MIQILYLGRSNLRFNFKQKTKKFHSKNMHKIVLTIKFCFVLYFHLPVKAQAVVNNDIYL